MTQIYTSTKRYSPHNTTRLTSVQLKEQLDSINLSARGPQPPTTYEIFGSNEDKYHPSQFLPKDSHDRQFIDTVEHAGNKVSFRNLVKALGKKLTEGTAKPSRAIAYGQYFTYLGKVITDAVEQLEAAKVAQDTYRLDKTEYDDLYVIYLDQREYEKTLSEFAIQSMEVEERQERRNASLSNDNTELKSELEKVKAKQGKLTALLQKLTRAPAPKASD